jgi:hypothetical protein
MIREKRIFSNAGVATSVMIYMLLVPVLLFVTPPIAEIFIPKVKPDAER